MKKEDFKDGNCYTYCLENKVKKEVCGFVVINIHKGKRKQYIECALISFASKEVYNLDDFTTGLLYTRKIFYSNQNILGIFCYEFHEHNIDIINKFQYIGEIKIDKSKFIIGGGGDAPTEPMLSNLLLNSRHILFSEYGQMQLKNIISEK